MSNPYAPPPGDAPPRGEGGSSTRRGPTGHPTRGQAPQGQPHGEQAPQGQPPQGPPPHGQGAHGRPPAAARQPVRTPPDPAAVEALSRRTGHVLAFLVATLLVTMMPFPVQVAAGLFALGALVTGARAVVLAWRAGVRTPALGALAGLVVLAGVMVLSFATMVAFWPAQQANAECVRLAVTTSAREACAEQLQRDVEDVLEGVLAPAGR